jgi:hypothetical protein
MTDYTKGDPELEAITAAWPSDKDVTYTLETVRAPIEAIRKMRRETPPTSGFALLWHLIPET